MDDESDRIRQTSETQDVPGTEGYRWCFGCGPQNPIGLHLHFQPTADGVTARFVPRAEHQGWDGIAHGGIVATLLDEALAYAAYHRAGPAVTASLDIRLRRPCPIDHTLCAEGRIVSVRHGLLFGEARLLDEDGQLIADAQGKLMLRGSGKEAGECASSSEIP